MFKLRHVPLVVALCHVIFLVTNGQQPERRAWSTPLQRLNANAMATDSAGIRAYSYQLVDQLVPDKAGKDYINELADRLARAETTARAEKKPLIPESAVVRSFNDLMKGIGAPTLKANEASIRRVRVASVSVPSSAPLFSAAKNGTHCYPGESVFLLWILIFNNGQISEHLLDEFGPRGDEKGESFRVFSAGGTADLHAEQLLSNYSSKHGRRATIKLFNNVAQTLGF